MSGSGFHLEFIELMQLTSIGLAAFMGAWIASVFDGVRVSAQSYTVSVVLPVILTVTLAPLPLGNTGLLWTLGLVALLVCLALIDAKTRTVPDVITIPVIVLGIIHAAIAGAPFLLFGGAAASLIIFAVTVSWCLKGEASWIGGGDVLMIAGALAWFGPGLIPDLMLITGTILAFQALVGLIPLPQPEACMPTLLARDSQLALAPALGVAQLVIWLGGPLF